MIFLHCSEKSNYRLENAISWLAEDMSIITKLAGNRDTARLPKLNLFATAA